jgi:hypothetical protein
MSHLPLSPAVVRDCERRFREAPQACSVSRSGGSGRVSTRPTRSDSCASWRTPSRCCPFTSPSTTRTWRTRCWDRSWGCSRPGPGAMSSPSASWTRWRCGTRPCHRTRRIGPWATRCTRTRESRRSSPRSTSGRRHRWAGCGALWPTSAAMRRSWRIRSMRSWPRTVGAVVFANCTSGADPVALAGQLVNAVLDAEPSMAPLWVPSRPQPRIRRDPGELVDRG